jgi:hypothetical protein
VTVVSGTRLLSDEDVQAVEHAARRVAELVLHASALADRMSRLPAPAVEDGLRPLRVARLRRAVAAGQRTMLLLARDVDGAGL